MEGEGTGGNGAAVLLEDHSSSGSVGSFPQSGSKGTRAELVLVGGTV